MEVEVKLKGGAGAGGMLVRTEPDRDTDTVSDDMRTLVLYVTSAFYLPEDFVILDQLMRHQNCGNS
jgi:hypothetical protein